MMPKYQKRSSCSFQPAESQLFLFTSQSKIALVVTFLSKNCNFFSFELLLTCNCTKRRKAFLQFMLRKGRCSVYCSSGTFETWVCDSTDADSSVLKLWVHPWIQSCFETGKVNVSFFFFFIWFICHLSSEYLNYQLTEGISSAFCNWFRPNSVFATRTVPLFLLLQPYRVCQAAPWHLQPGGELCEPGERAAGEAAGLSRRDERREQGQPHELHRQPAGTAWAGEGRALQPICYSWSSIFKGAGVAVSIL